MQITIFFGILQPITKEGYKSFTGGWIESHFEEGHMYYWNTSTGESSWTLPGAIEEDEEEMVADLREDAGAAMEGAVEGAGGGGELVEHDPNQHHPMNTFADSYHTAGDYYSNGVGEEEQPQDGHHADYYGTQQPYYDEYGQLVYPDASSGTGAGAEPQYDEYGGYYDPHTGEYVYPEHHHDPHQQDQHDDHGAPYAADPSGAGAGADPAADPWSIHDALGDHAPEKDSYVRPRHLPVPVKEEVAVYSKKEGVSRQLSLLGAQDRWQNSLVKCQHFITEQKSKYLQMRVEMFEKVSARVETRLNSFVEDIKVMQKALKKDLGDSMSTERDLRRLFETEDKSGVQAEKLSFILESLEKFKGVASERYESAFTQIDKFGAEWEILKTELLQVGDIYDEGVAANLEQCRMTCEHNAKLFAYDQLKIAGRAKHVEMRAMRNAVHRTLRADTFEEEESRKQVCEEHSIYYYRNRALKKRAIEKELGGWSRTIEAELAEAGFPAIAPELVGVPEEEHVMSYMLTQIEMELSLGNDFDSITDATKNMAMELQQGVREFDDTEKQALADDGSWYNKHRETLERHEQALHTTLTKVRNRMNEGYQLLNAKLEALDYDVEKAAEEELFTGSQASAGAVEELD